MLGQHLFAKTDARMRQLKPRDVPFGGFHVAIIGDFGQLPPVGDRPLYSPPPPPENGSESAQLSRSGATLYALFKESFCLQVIHRQEGADQANFRTLLTHARNGGLTVDDWTLLSTRQSSALSPAEISLFDDSICLFTKTDAVDEANRRHLLSLNNPCARILAKHDGGPEAAKASAEDAAGLEASVLLAQGAKVMITRNLWQKHGESSSDSFPVNCIQSIPSIHRSGQRRNRSHRRRHLVARLCTIRSPPRRTRILPDLHGPNPLANHFH
ncbi:hypothetical protein BV20DRAFT_549063 [Pilatotrama ljubarskyi]|nr:hypothetical protein BV20DRAFT_549063 [Pilatotrama ljubarskyi]